jgi:DNA-binding ferritin-like protein (Dps family)
MLPSYRPEYERYEARAKEHPARTAYAEDVIALHAWHGSERKRQYTERKALFAKLADVLEIVQLDSQGIWEIRGDSVLAQQVNATLCAYFRGRQDDDVSHVGG